MRNFWLAGAVSSAGVNLWPSMTRVNSGIFSSEQPLAAIAIANAAQPKLPVTLLIVRLARGAGCTGS
jgi:hypothetical protein